MVLKLLFSIRKKNSSAVRTFTLSICIPWSSIWNAVFIRNLPHSQRKLGCSPCSCFEQRCFLDHQWWQGWQAVWWWCYKWWRKEVQHLCMIKYCICSVMFRFDNYSSMAIRKHLSCWNSSLSNNVRNLKLLFFSIDFLSEHARFLRNATITLQQNGQMDKWGNEGYSFILHSYFKHSIIHSEIYLLK